ncbi:MAG: hypothetical protein ACLPN5_06490 [Roseiarcus sp.]
MTLSDAIVRAGLVELAAAGLEPSERAGALASVRTVVLVGMAGRAPWAAFAASPEFSDGAPHPLDRWSRRVVAALARELGALPLFPFDGPPYLPFQAWARRAGSAFASPLGLGVHRRYGLWHGFRGALGFAEALDIPAAGRENPCDACAGRPCLSACPVGAFTLSGYDVEACAAWLRERGVDCRHRGCLARRACPLGLEHAYAPEQASFHMEAFLSSRESSRGAALRLSGESRDPPR